MPTLSPCHRRLSRASDVGSPLVEILTAVFTGVPALAVVILGWLVNRKDLQSEISHLREQNLKLTDALHLSMYGHARDEK